MLGEVLTLFLLTVLFTACTAAALLVRKRLHGGQGQTMYLIWLAVMLAAVIPLQIAPPVYHVIVSARTVTEVQPPYRDMHPEILLITEASYPIREGELPILRAHLSAQEEAVISESGDAVAFNVSALMLAAVRFLVFIWAAGFSFCLIRELAEYRDIKRDLLENSDPVTDNSMLALFDLCREQLGLRRDIPLRRIREDTPATPCVIGFLRPTVYLSAFCDDMDSSHLANIFTHELCHVKRCDMLYKLLMVLTASVHWFNPTSILLKRAVTEDLEMACDATVLRHRTSVTARDYMDSILCVAERLKRERQKRRQREPLFRAAFFMANDTTPNYLKRRYLHMKTTREKKNLKTVYTVCAGVLALITAANVAVLSSCSYVEAADGYRNNAAGANTYLCDPIEVAFSNHFHVPAFSDITDEQFASVASVDVYLLTPQDGTPDRVFVSFDGGNVELLMPCILPLDVYENAAVPAIEIYDQDDPDKFDTQKFRAFYAIKDPADPALEPRAVAEMQALIPITKEMSVALYDPYTTAREDDYLYSILYDAALVRSEVFSETAIRAKLETMTAMADAEISVCTAETLDGFGVDLSLFQIRGEAYKEYMEDYRVYNSAVNTADPADLAAGEVELQMDINGNGVIGE